MIQGALSQLFGIGPKRMLARRTEKSRRPSLPKVKMV